MNTLFLPTVQDLWGFIRSPRLTFSSTPTTREIWQIFGVILLVDILLNMLAIMPVEALKTLGWISEKGHAFDLIKDWHWSLIFLMAAVIAPVFEEVVFRAWLVDSPAYLLFGAIVVLPISCWFVSLYGSGLVFITIVWSVGALCFIACSALAVRYYHNEEFQISLSQWWSDHFRLPYYLSVFAFGIVHFSNWEAGEAHNVAFALVLVLPQIVSGFILGYLRLRFGLIWSIALHSIFNGIFIGIGLLTQF